MPLPFHQMRKRLSIAARFGGFRSVCGAVHVEHGRKRRETNLNRRAGHADATEKLPSAELHCALLQTVRLKADTTTPVRLKPDTTYCGSGEIGHDVRRYYFCAVWPGPDATFVELVHCLRNSGDCTSATNRFLTLKPDALNWSYSWSMVFSSAFDSSRP